MVANGANGATATDNEEPWTEQKYADALQRLNELQDQLHVLRSSFPGILSQFNVAHSSPEALFNAFEHYAATTVASLDQLKKQWNAQETQSVFAQAQKSRDNDNSFDVEGLSRHHDPPIKTEDSDESI